jgi:hypothetical protein
MIPYHEHVEARMTPGLVRRLESGESLALVSVRERRWSPIRERGWFAPRSTPAFAWFQYLVHPRCSPRL